MIDRRGASSKMAPPKPSSQAHRIYNSPSMKKHVLIALAALLFLAACSKQQQPTSATTPPSAAPSSKAPDGVQLKLQEYAGNSATNCGRLDIHAPEAQSKGAADCALQASKAKKPFYVAYDMPGMAVGVAGNAEGKLFTARSEGGGVSTGDCPSELRLASSGRVTCFAPGDMGSMGAGHTAIPPGMPNPHALPKAK